MKERKRNPYSKNKADASEESVLQIRARAGEDRSLIGPAAWLPKSKVHTLCNSDGTPEAPRPYMDGSSNDKCREYL